jgi:hypothetical protein
VFSQNIFIFAMRLWSNYQYFLTLNWRSDLRHCFRDNFRNLTYFLLKWLNIYYADGVFGGYCDTVVNCTDGTGCGPESNVCVNCSFNGYRVLPDGFCRQGEPNLLTFNLTGIFGMDLPTLNLEQTIQNLKDFNSKIYKIMLSTV